MIERHPYYTVSTPEQWQSRQEWGNDGKRSDA